MLSLSAPLIECAVRTSGCLPARDVEERLFTAHCIILRWFCHEQSGSSFCLFKCLSTILIILDMFSCFWGGVLLFLVEFCSFF